MNSKSLNVVIFGATGMVGSGVIRECITNPSISSVISVNRRSTNIKHDKITEIIHQDFLDYSAIESSLTGLDACFYCLGVSQLQVSDEASYHKITYDFTIAAAEMVLKLNPKITFCFLSGAGTDETMKSKLMWARIKGKAEHSLSTMNFKSQYHFRPALIFPKRGIKHSSFLTKILWPVYPLLNRLFPAYIINSTEFGKAMINVCLNGADSLILENKDIKECAN